MRLMLNGQRFQSNDLRSAVMFNLYRHYILHCAKCANIVRFISAIFTAFLCKKKRRATNEPKVER